MSFSVSAKGKPTEVVAAIEADANVPKSVAAFVAAGVALVGAGRLGDRLVAVSAYGHLHDGNEGNHEESTATISIKPVAVEQLATEESAAKA
jgi:hypothetical protein